MDRETNAKHGVLENMLFDANAEPTDLPFSLLEYITNGFSDDMQIGKGGFAVVYKGVLGNGMVAVKKLSETYGIHEKQFKKEVNCLMKAKHKNVVRFLGYCSETRGKMTDYEGTSVMADVGQRLLCFEYLSKGSLDKHITGSCVLEWRKLYRIIKGICEGLYYLHVKQHIVHSDLKAQNILLDDNMDPKIADFGVSRRFGEKQSQTFTSNVIGTFGYMAPEFLDGQITFKTDIYSLGVIIIEILMGEKGPRDVMDVLDIWRKRFQQPHEDVQLEQIRVVAQIGIECTLFEPNRRPNMQNIIDRLDGIASMDQFFDTNVSSSSTGQVEKDSRELHCAPNTVQGDTSCEVMATTLLVLYGKSAQEQHLLASSASSLSLDDGELSVSLAPDISKDDEGFDAGAYMGALQTRRFGMWMLWSPHITSTHDFVAQNFAKLPVGAVCIADKQFKGRGQSKNVWTSPAGCLMFSFTLRMNDSRKTPFVQSVVCIAMVEAVKELSSAKGFPGLDIRIKWPNDLYMKGLKVGGILYTSVYQPMVHNICIGIGLNVDNKKPTTCLNAALQELNANSPGLKREDILASFFNKFEVLFDIFSHKGFRALEERYYNVWLHSGQIIVVHDGLERESVGIVVTIQGLTRSGNLHAIGEDGKSYEVHSDGNSFVASHD